MAFLLASTVIVLSISISQTAIKQEANFAQKIALKEANNTFDNMRQQILVAREGYAGSAYGRLMPFEKFSVGDNWFEIKQIPGEATYQAKTYDAINLFAIFAIEKGSEGKDIEVYNVLQNTEWGWDGTGDTPKIEYLVLPQCYKFWVLEDSNIVEFGGGTALDDDCEANFEQSNIKSYGVQLILEAIDLQADPLQCNGGFSETGNCKQEAYNGLEHYVEVRLLLDGCAPTCNIYPGFSPDGVAVVSANFTGSPPEYTWIQIKYTTPTNFQIDLDNNYLIKIEQNVKLPKDFTVRIEFNEPIEEIVLASDLYAFSVKKPGFDICRATDESGCRQ